MALLHFWNQFKPSVFKHKILLARHTHLLILLSFVTLCTFHPSHEVSSKPLKSPSTKIPMMVILLIIVNNYVHYAAAAAKSLQSCPTLCDPIDGSPPGSPIPCPCPGKDTGVGCHFLLHCMQVKSESEVTQSCPTLHYNHPIKWRALKKTEHVLFYSVFTGYRCLTQQMTTDVSAE